MGNCRSSTASSIPQHNGNAYHHPSDRRWSDRGPRGHHRQPELASMARVGSRVLRQSTASGGSGGPTPKGRLRAHKASTYDHVHEMVERSIDGCHESNHTGRGGSARNLSGKVGLTNLGNTCFLNSSLQCLSNTIPLTDYFLGYDFRGEINADNFLGTGGALVTSFAELVKHLWLGSDAFFQPTAFKSSLAQFAPQFSGYEQQDAQELLAYLLDGIHEDLNRVKTRPYIEDADCDGTNDEGDAIVAWSNYLQRNQSIIVDLFQGQLRNTMKCRTAGCGHINVKFDPFMYLSLPISEACNSLDGCLDLFCEEEMLTGDEQWYCPKCKTHVDATKKIDLFMLPPILIVHLKRFKFSASGRRSKLDKRIRFALNDWDLSKAKRSEGGTDPLYDLYAISHHMGSVGSGHYTAHAKNRFDGEWYNFNDSQCRRIDPAKDGLGSASSAYCLFYNRVERVPHARSGHVEKKTIIRRQSVGRPELWPHLQRAKATEWKSVRANDFVWDAAKDNGVHNQLPNISE